MNNKRSTSLELFSRIKDQTLATILSMLLLAGMVSACSPTAASPAVDEVQTQPTSEPRPLPTESIDEPEMEPTPVSTQVETAEILPTSVPVPVTSENDWVKGAPDAAVSVIVYEDFQ